jgi:membrane protease YdiL (CAAX protease family)
MREPEGTVKLLAMAAAWFILAAVLALVASAGALLAGGISLNQAFTTVTGQQKLILVLAPMTQLCLFVACLRRGRRTGSGNLREGLAWLGVQRRWDVALLAGTAAVVAMAHVAMVVRFPAYRAFFEHAQTSLPLPQQTGLGVGAYAAWVLLVIVVGAPLTEELFFRGWLWVGLSRWWSVWVTAPATGCLWLLAHYSDGGWRRLLALVPAMILVSVARSLGGSVKASMAVHAANNAVLSAVLVAGRVATG